MREVDQVMGDATKHYELIDATGDAQITVHRLFQGVELAFYSVHMESLSLGKDTQDRVIEIHHCREGRIEQRFEDKFFYLMPGDLSVAIRTNAVKAYSFPLRHYHGTTIVLNTEDISEEFIRLLNVISVKPVQVASSLCAKQACRIFRADTRIARVFSELYNVPQRIRGSYFKLKVMELLLILSDMNAEQSKCDRVPLPQTQVHLAHRAQALLRQDLSRHMTIQEAAEHLNVSPTCLKQAFRGVFGMPVYSYTRVLKMQAAALALCRTDKPVLEIACEYGYENGSKFSSAFREVMGESPSEYRRNHR